jgi:hypothetical protein
MWTGRNVMAYLAFGALGVAATGAGTLDLQGKPFDPFMDSARARVFLFVHTDCPLTNRYAPELHRIASEFVGKGVEFWLIYPDPAETSTGIETQIEQYKLPGRPLRDPHHALVARSRATVSPEAAVFDSAGRLIYTGRIDDLYVDFGKARPAALTHDLEDAITGVLAGKKMTFSRTRAVGCYLADVQ